MSTIAILFVITAANLICALLSIIGSLAGHPVTFTFIKTKTFKLYATSAFLFFPSLIFQIWFWAVRLGVI